MKTQKGITLIALIITIIVMLILVGVSVSVALNTGLFKTAQGVAKNTEAEKVNEQALSGGQVTVGNKTYNSMQEYIDSMKAPAKAFTYEDTDSSGGLNKGDLVTHITSGEEFFVIKDIVGDTVTLLSKYNLEEGKLAQYKHNTTNDDGECSNSVPFSSGYYWIDDMSNEEFIESGYDLNKLNKESSGDAIAIAEAYAGTILGEENKEKGRLMTKGEADELENDEILYGTIDCNYLNYWLGSALSGYNSFVWSVNGGSSSVYDSDFVDGYSCGVRPVLEISQSLI